MADPRRPDSPSSGLMLSIVVPVYRSEACLEPLSVSGVRSLRRQQLPSALEQV